MNFVKFKGPLIAGENLTVGKMYLGRPAMEGVDVASFDFFMIADDKGNPTQVTLGDRFAIPKKVYAVVTKAFNGFDAGRVIVVADISKDGLYVSVEGHEDLQTLDSFAVLDSTNLYPGVVVRIRSIWKKVVQINEDQFIAVDGACGSKGFFWCFETPCKCVLAVSDGDVLTKPMVRCVVGGSGVTEGSWYHLQKSKKDIVVVKNDLGEITEYLAGRFKM